MSSSSNRDASPVRSPIVFTTPVISSHIEELPIEHIDPSEAPPTDTMLRYYQYAQKPTHRMFTTMKVGTQEPYSIALLLYPEPEQAKLEFNRAINRVAGDAFDFKADSEGKKYDIEKNLRLGLVSIEAELEKEREGTNAEFEAQQAHYEKERLGKVDGLREECDAKKRRINAKIADLERECNALRTTLTGLDAQLERDVASSDALYRHILEEQKGSFLSERNKVLLENASKQKHKLKKKMRKLEQQRLQEREERVRAWEILTDSLAHIMPGGGNSKEIIRDRREISNRQPLDQELSDRDSQANHKGSETLFAPHLSSPPQSLARKAAVKSAPIQPFHQRSGRPILSDADPSSGEEDTGGIRNSSGSREPKGMLDNSDSHMSSLCNSPPSKMYMRIKKKSAPKARPAKAKPAGEAPVERARRSERLVLNNIKPREKNKSAPSDLEKEFDRFLQQPFIDLVVNHYDVLVSTDRRKFEKLWEKDEFFEGSYRRSISKCWESRKHDLGIEVFIEMLSQVSMFPRLLFRVEISSINHTECAFCGQPRSDKIQINRTMYREDTNQLWYMDSKCAERFSVALEFPAAMRDLCAALKKHNKFPSQRPEKLEEFAEKHWDTFRQVFLNMQLLAEPDLRTEMSSISYSE